MIATWRVGVIGGLWLALCSQVGRAEPVAFAVVMKRATKAATVILVLAPITWTTIHMFGTRYIPSADPDAYYNELDVRVMSSGIMHSQSYLLATVIFLAIGLVIVWDRCEHRNTEK